MDKPNPLPARAARKEDCKFMCDAKAWCVESKFSTEDNGSCTLSSCKAQSLSAYVLGVARRHRPYTLTCVYRLDRPRNPILSRRGLHRQLPALECKECKEFTLSTDECDHSREQPQN